ncbi:GNAT family N-acetyltransferase, partial [bacterium]|nr:GNAT family N-acetyltransferase [bacterium]
MEIREIDNLEGLRAIEEPWCRLFDRAGGGAYDSPAFLLPWLEAAREDYALRVLTAWEGSELQALAPLVAKSAGKAGIAFRLVSFPAHGESPPFEILASSDRAPIVAAFLEHVTHRTPWHMLRLEHLAEDSPTVGALAEAATAAGLRFEESVSRRTFLVPVRTDWNTYLASRSRNLRRTLKRGRRSLEQHGTVDVRRYPDGDLTREQALEMALAAMEHSWKDIRRGRGPWSRLPLALAESLDRRGMLSLRFLRVDGEPVAYLYEIVHGRVVHAFHSAYDARFQEGSPGALLLEDAIRDAHERGRERYDFTGREPYMAAWADERAVSVEARVTPRSLHARIRGGLYLRIHAARRARARR